MAVNGAELIELSCPSNSSSIISTAHQSLLVALLPSLPLCVSWSAKKQPTVARSTAEAEYRALASAAAELTWITYILRDIGVPQTWSSTLFSDNLSALYLTTNPVFHARTKRIELDYHFIREKVALGAITTRFVPSPSQIADMFTKPLARTLFGNFKNKLGLWTHPTTSLRGSIEPSKLEIEHLEEESSNHATKAEDKAKPSRKVSKKGKLHVIEENDIQDSVYHSPVG